MRLYRVLFVCIGNSCRSQMAEAFAARYGADVMVARSAGLAPCEMVAPVTREVMLEKGIDLDGATPKGLEFTGTDFDLIVNMSGRRLPGAVKAEVREWDVEDPIWVSRERHREIRDQIEGLVRELIGELRRRRGVRARI
jgi:arsenate reductase